MVRQKRLPKSCAEKVAVAKFRFNRSAKAKLSVSIRSSSLVLANGWNCLITRRAARSLLAARFALPSGLSISRPAFTACRMFSESSSSRRRPRQLPLCHVERSRDISHCLTENGERFLDFARNDRIGPRVQLHSARSAGRGQRPWLQLPQ